MTGLAVDAVDLTTLPDDRLTEAMARSGAAFHDVVVTLSNRSAATQFVPCAVNRIRYDPGTRTLHVSADDGSDDEYALCPPHPVPHTAIRPGAGAGIEYRLVSPITYSTAAGELQAVQIDTDVDAIDCTLTYTDEEPPQFVNLTARAPRAGARHEVHARWQRP